MCMLLGMSKQLVYVFPGFYNKETMFSNNLKTNRTPQEVIVWFGCGHGKKKKPSFSGCASIVETILLFLE